ncbi:MAG: DUF2089 domain-containing protein [Thermomicrobiales bacterium]|nr:DUF2089 domain-containing protein [Thermomicrobiales bacterium]
MDHGYPIPGRCPVCGDTFDVTRLECAHCHSRLEGRFTLGPFGRLDREQLRFAEVFLRNRGVIKDVEVELGLSYPTIRARLDEVVRALDDTPPPAADATAPRLPPAVRRERRRAVLQELRDRRIDPDEAAARLATIDRRSAAESEPTPVR